MTARKLSPKLELVIFVGLPILLLSFIFVGHTAFRALEFVDKKRENFAEHHARVLAVLLNVRYLQAREDSVALRFVLSKDGELLDDLNATRQRTEGKLKLLLEMDQDPLLFGFVNEIRKIRTELHDAAEPAFRMRLSGSSISDVNDYLDRHGKSIDMRAIALIDKIIEIESNKLNETRAEVNAGIQSLKYTLALSAILTLLGSIIIAAFIMELARLRKAHDRSREQLYRQAETTAQARKEVLEVVAHDLKNPLGAIKMSTQMLIEELEATDPNSFLKSGLEINQRSAETMGKLIADLLDHSKIESGQFVIEKSMVNISNLLERMVLRLSPLVSAKRFEFKFDSPDGDVYADCDEARIDQAVSNLLGNAIKFTPERGQIRLSMVATDAIVKISVSDTGPGIPEDCLSHVFDRFWQVKENATKGNGLGLAIAKAVVDGHGGRIDVKSELGTGTIFAITLPIFTP